jgi:general secretion pathway protein B
MSYILDALTRSEQERNRGSVPDLHTVQLPFPRFEGPRASRTAYLVAGLLLAGAAAVGAWQHYEPAQGKSAPMPAEPIALQRPQPLPAMPKPPPPAPLDPVPSEKPAADDPPPMRVAPAAKNPRPSPPPIATARATVPPAQSAPRKPATQAREERALPPSELPVALQKELPPLAISGFADSRETGRMAIVNGRVVVEGDEFAGLTVEQIAPGSLTLRYKDHRFRQAY